MPRALVTGATGLVGSHIVERLRHEGWQVRALVRSPSAWLDAAGVECVRGDVLDSASFAAAAAGCDVLFHTAATVTSSGGWETYRSLNVEGARNAIDAAASAKAKLVQISSVAVYGLTSRYQPDGRKTDETTPLAPLPEQAFYARSKRESEQLVLSAHKEGRIWATAVRPAVVYGPRDRQFVPRIARLLSARMVPVIGGGKSTLSIVHAANVAAGAILAATNDRAGGQAYNLANDFDVSVRAFYGLAATGLGRSIWMVPVPYVVANAAFNATMRTMRALTGGRFAVLNNASLEMIACDNPFTSDRARGELGWSPTVRPERGIPEAFRWWLTNR